MSNFGVYYRAKQQKEAPTESRSLNEEQIQNILITSDDLSLYASYINLLSSVVDLAALYLEKQESQEDESSSPNAAT